jgi:deoxyribodipyrimidine photolyase-related protein
VSSATYIDKMSHYCGSCYYKKAIKVGEKSCPFNSLYWNFYDKNEGKLSKNPRIGMMYKVWQKMKIEDKTALLEQADFYLKNIYAGTNRQIFCVLSFLFYLGII